MPAFSICLPVYNGARYIGKAVQSVIDQSFPDWELIIYNNGSTDQTSDVVHQFTDQRIQSIEEKESRSGAVGAWHKVMSLGRGDYVLMLGHDDWFKPDFLKTAQGCIQQHALDVFSGWMDCYDPEYRFTEIVTSASFIQSVPNVKREGSLWLFDGKGYIAGFLADFEQGFSKMHLSTTFMRRTLYEQVGGFNAKLQYCAESELYLKLAHAGAKFGFHGDRALVNYIGGGKHRRASYMPVDRKYHDFYMIPRIMLDEGMVGEQDYARMINSVNSLAVLQGFGYSLGPLIGNILRNTPKKKIAWVGLALISALWARIRLAVNVLFRKAIQRVMR